MCNTVKWYYSFLLVKRENSWLLFKLNFILSKRQKKEFFGTFPLFCLSTIAIMVMSTENCLVCIVEMLATLADKAFCLELLLA